MKAVAGWCVLFLFSAGLQAQSRGGYVARGGFPSVVYPGGTSATVPGTVRFNSSVLFPGGGGPLPNSYRSQYGAAYGTIDPGFASRLGTTVRGRTGPAVPNRGGSYRHPGGGTTGVVAIPYAYPVYVGGGYGYGYAPAETAPSEAADQPAPQQQPNVIVIYPQQAPVPQQTASRPAIPLQEPSQAEPSQEPAVSNYESPRYLIAFKDHTIYSAMAYWVDGDTLHYFTSGNTHNQVSLALVDRSLTDRLNKESGVELHLPPQ